MFKSKGITLVSVLMAVIISGCSNDEQAKSNVLVASQSYEIDVNKMAWLRNHLPNETIAYLNIPTPWNFLFDAKADTLHGVQSLPAHADQINLIKQGIIDNYSNFIPAQYSSLFQLLLNQTQSPMELAILNYSGSAFMPSFAIGTRLKNTTAESLMTTFESILKQVGLDSTIEKKANEPIWTFKIEQFNAFLKYQESSGQLLLLSGMGVNMERLNALWDKPAGDLIQVMNELDISTDPSGLNPKMWFAPAKIYQLGGAFIPPKGKVNLEKLGYDKVEYVWFGTESSEGNAALTYHMIMPEKGWRLMVPRVTDWFDVSMAGFPKSVLQLSLPTAKQIEQGYESLKQQGIFSQADLNDFAKFTEFQQTTGLDFMEMLDAYYQQVFYVSDQSGSWVAIKIKDQAQHEKFVTSLNSLLNIKPISKSLSGVEIFQGDIDLYAQLLHQIVADTPANSGLVFWLKALKEHVYWYVEDDVIYFSSVPQILADKRNHESMMLSNWLKINQGDDWQSAIFAYGKDVHDLPRDLYHVYLNIINALADLAHVEIDLYSLPTASELNLPESGRMNIVVSSDQQKVSFKLGYEYSVFESLVYGEGGIYSFYMVSVLMAYAIPAYRDYTIRAKVGERLAIASGLKIAVSEQYFNEGSFVGVNQLVNIDEFQYEINEESGAIVLYLEDLDSMFTSDDRIYLEPEIHNNQLSWGCYGTIKASYLPASCR